MKAMLTSSILGLCLLQLSPVAGADIALPKGASSPCKNISDVCEKHDYTAHDPRPGHDLILNCIKPIVDGKHVGGVKVNKADIAACKAKEQPKPN